MHLIFRDVMLLEDALLPLAFKYQKYRKLYIKLEIYLADLRQSGFCLDKVTPFILSAYEVN